MQVKQLKQGDLFRLSEASPMVLVRDFYIRSTKKYLVYRAADVNYSLELRGDREVFKQGTEA